MQTRENWHPSRVVDTGKERQSYHTEILTGERCNGRCTRPDFSANNRYTVAELREQRVVPIHKTGNQNYQQHLLRHQLDTDLQKVNSQEVHIRCRFGHDPKICTTILFRRCIQKQAELILTTKPKWVKCYGPLTPTDED